VPLFGQSNRGTTFATVAAVGTNRPRSVSEDAVEPIQPPDNGVASIKPALLGLVIVASTVALLGTSDDSPGPVYDVYTFERRGADGGFVELTRGAPRATVSATITVTSLGPEDVDTTGSAEAVFDLQVTSKDLAEGASAPFLSLKLGSPDDPSVTERQIIGHVVQHQPLTFVGNCTKPSEGAACHARFELDLSRTDDGAADGVVRLDWTFDLASKGQVQIGLDDKQMGRSLGPLDPPWTVEVAQ